jgi:diaminohydroxyphosphoribosylaminopyrimidine deaminase/5-amino-6-(5-phosphoribosylamino)uracil reductase
VLDGLQETIVFAGEQGNYSGLIQTVHVDPSYSLVDVMQELSDRQIVSVFVEGGAKLHNSFLRSGLWDEARVFTGKMLFTQGVKAPELDETPDEVLKIGETSLEIYMNKLNTDEIQ